MAVGTILCLVIPQQLMGLFSETDTTIEAGASALRIISAGFIVSALSVVISGTFEGLGMGMPSLVISLLRYLVIVLIAYLLSLPFGAVGVVARLLGDGTHFRHSLLPSVLRMLFEKTPEGKRTKHAKNRMKKTPLMLRRFVLGELLVQRASPRPSPFHIQKRIGPALLVRLRSAVRHEPHLLVEADRLHILLVDRHFVCRKFFGGK